MKGLSMNNMFKVTLILVTVTSLMAGNLFAGTDVSSNITGQVTWTKANSPYHLKGQIYVTPGASLTIEAGVVVANFVDDQGSLAVCRGAQIHVMGTKNQPVIMTSAEDVANWTGSVVTRGGSNGTVSAITTMGDSKTGIWLERCNDWGNLTIMGNALISASSYGGVQVGDNTAYPDGTNEKQMEGLVGGSETYYGGDNDDDDSGEIHYLSLRYGGKVVGLANELNGLSMGGIGRSTDVDHVEIMNNVDDGIETWGGTVNYKYINIWNIGDDSMDVDEGWRGCAQYGLIVQGYSIDAGQGSGVGDNCFETDGAEDSDAQPMTTARFANFTVIGQTDGDHGTAWRDNARVQYNNCIWMDLGEQLVKADGDDGDGQSGYGHNGTMSWADTWTTSYNTWAASAYAQINLGGESLTEVYGQYLTQNPDDSLACIKDSVFYNNLFAAAYTEATNRGVFDASNRNIVEPEGMPIQALVRGELVERGGKDMEPVTFINPCAANDAVTTTNKISHASFQPAPFRGGFSPYYNWLEGWTAVDAYSMTDTSMNTACDTTSTIVPDGGDLDNDMDTDFVDFAIFANTWLAD